MLESFDFYFNNKSSKDFGVMIVTTQSGLYDDLFLPTRSIREEKTPYNNTPYFMGVDIEPLSFPLTLYIEDWENRNNLRQIARWLFQPTYKPISFQSNYGQIYDVMFIDDSSRFHNGCRDGYLTVNVRASSPFSRSTTRTINITSSNLSPTTVLINNDGDLESYPRLVITKTSSNGDIKITNKNSNKSTILLDITLGETIEIDFKTKDITSSLESQNIYRYDNHNGVWLDFILGENELLFEGDFDVKLEYELQYLVEDYPIYSRNGC